jgi:hypothetical protein
LGRRFRGSDIATPCVALPERTGRARVSGRLLAAPKFAGYNSTMAEVLRSGDIALIRCSDALEFMSVLDPIDGMFRQGATLGAFVFRGIKSAKFDLLPSAFRAGTALLDLGGWVSSPRATVHEQCWAELTTIRRFFEIAARHGVRLPEDSQTLRHQLEEWDRHLSRVGHGNSVIWPPYEFYSLIALAQHYGIPTRALDWTWSSLTAAYFAAREADAQTSNEVCVWVFSYVAREIERIMAWRNPDSERPLVVFTAPGADNENLRAQRGMFMLWRQTVDTQDTPFVQQPYEPLLIESMSFSRGMPILSKVTVPATESAQILALAAAAGITAGALFPGPWGAARQFHEEKETWAQNVPYVKSSFAKQIEQQVVALFRAPRFKFELQHRRDEIIARSE